MKALARVGFAISRQRGSHVILRRDVPFGRLSIPDHKELDTGTLRAIIRQAGLDIDEFAELLE
ncbi:MAG: type II toxin-antitoxin system HicA family toxin [Chloroflexi bacterium]|nr:type II toxin-antitoxin system HicA family toxin [Chloroflexota bacterium]